MRISTILAHPDDAELWAGGTILKHSRQGDFVDMLTFADPSSKRRSEATVGAQLLGARCHFGRRVALGTMARLVQCIARFLKETKPDVVITHWEGDAHFEHVAVWEAVVRCSTRCKIDRGFPGMLLSCDTYASLGLHEVFDPTLYVDVSAVFEDKLAAIKAHASQPISKWTDMAKILGRLQGLRSGCSYAEGFRELSMLGQKRACVMLPNVVRSC